MADPYADPTVDDFLDRFPEFEDIDPELIEPVLEFAQTFVGKNWSALDYRNGVLYLTAHLLSVNRSLGVYDSLSSSNDARELYVRSIGIGDRRVVFEQGGVLGKATQSALTDFSTTAYGQMFEMLLRRNVAPIALI